jgi:hypothetical protein
VLSSHIREYLREFETKLKKNILGQESGVLYRECFLSDEKIEVENLVTRALQHLLFMNTKKCPKLHS